MKPRVLLLLLPLSLAAWLLIGEPTPPSGAPKLLPSAVRQAMHAEEAKHEKAAWDLWLATPISFYGKVLDERGKPIPAIRINASW